MYNQSYEEYIRIILGYPNYSYFCQSFREYFGKSPEKYRLEKANEMGL